LLANSEVLELRETRKTKIAMRETQNPPAFSSRSRLLAKLLLELQHGEQFETLADAIDALKCRAARLRIPYTVDDVSAAVSLVRWRPR